jgi:hypothetical protein
VSPDGLQLAWAPGRDILYQRPGNQNYFFLDQSEAESPLLTNDQLGWIFDPSYSPDGKQVATCRNLGLMCGLHVLPVDGPVPREDHGRQLTGALGFGSISQRVDGAPYRGKDIKLVTHVRAQVSPAPAYTARVEFENPYRGKASLHMFGIALPAGAFEPIGWSPDGRLIYAYDRNDARHLVAVPAGGGQPKPFVTLPMPEGQSISECRVSPDGRHVVFTVEQLKSDIRIITNFDPAIR